MKMKNETYDTLKWIIAIVLPAFAVFVQTVGTAVHWSYTDLVVTIITAVATFLGACFMISNNKYYKNHAKGKIRK